MKKNVFLVLLFSSLSLASFSQKFVIGMGCSFLSDVALLSPAGHEGSTQTSFSMGTGAVEMKYNIFAFNTDLGLSIATGPGIGFMIGTLDYPGEQASGPAPAGLLLRLPVLLQLDFGSLSTFETMKTKGIGIGIGFEYTKIGLLSEIDGFISPTIRAGFRYINRYKLASGIALKYTLPRKLDFNYTELASGEAVAMTTQFNVSLLTLSWIRYFNY